MRRATIAATLCLATAASPFARADGSTDQAARLFRAGTDSYARHEFREAARQFESAYRIAPRGAAVYDAGLAWEQAGESARAADDFATAIGNPDTSSQQRSDATARLKALEARLARLVVTGPADAHVTVDDGSEASLPLGVHLAPGTHALFVNYAGGRTESRDIDAQAGAEVVVRLSDPSAGNTSTQEAASSSSPHEAPPAPSGDGGASTRRTLAWVSVAGAGVASVLAITFYVVGENALTQFNAGGDRSASQHDQAVTDRTIAQVLGVLALAAGGASVVLFLTSSPTAASSTSLRVGPASAALRVTF